MVDNLKETTVLACEMWYPSVAQKRHLLLLSNAKYEEGEGVVTLAILLTHTYWRRTDFWTTSGLFSQVALGISFL